MNLFYAKGLFYAKTAEVAKDTHLFAASAVLICSLKREKPHLIL